MTRVALFLPLVLLSGCVQPDASVTAPPQDADQCGAARLQGLVGQPKAILARMELPKGARIVGPDQAVTMDFRADRLNIETGSDERISRIGCY